MLMLTRSDRVPELPEVETIKETLKRQILNRKIRDVRIYLDKIIQEPSIDTFIKQIKGETILDIKRRGKWLIFNLNNYDLVCHLRMEGKLFVTKKEEPLGKYDHVVFVFDHMELRYADMRKFGRMYLTTRDKSNQFKPLLNLGLEPFNHKLTPTYLKTKFKLKKIPIKTALLDQNIIAGIGNIYANEILFLSHIHPLTKVHELTNKQLTQIIKNTKIILKEAIRTGGTTIRSYTSAPGVTGGFQSQLKVHNRKHQKCYKCQTPIQKIKVGGRGTYYCPTCQK